MKKFILFVSFISVVLSVVISSFTIYGLIKPLVKKAKGAAEPAPFSIVREAVKSSENPYEDPNDPNTKKDGTCFSTDVMTGYFMEIKLASQQNTGIVSEDYGDRWGAWSGTSVFSNKTHTATAILTFVDMKYNGQSVFVSVFTKVRYVMSLTKVRFRLWAQEDFTEANDNAIRIPASYYNYMLYAMQNQGAALRRFNITFMKNDGKDVVPLQYTQEVDVRLYTKDIPADSDDPASPNFRLDNWAGIMAAASAQTGCSSENLTLVLYIVIALVAVFIILTVVRWVFSK